MANTTIWDALGKTDPKHTKPFSRAGGFKGTAMKPIWIVRRMTEQFGPVGEGWGMTKPEFQVIEADKERLVYCSVGVWRTSPDKVFYGVGGDKVTAARQSGTFNSDEAFKMAYTDAVNNALKYLGVGADIHMGQFDDSKYVAQVDAEFAEAERKANQPKNWGGLYPTKTALMKGLKTHHAEIERIGVEGNMDDLDGYLSSPEYQEFIKTATTHAPYYLEGELPEGAPPEFIQTFRLEQKSRDMIALRGGN